MLAAVELLVPEVDEAPPQPVQISKPEPSSLHDWTPIPTPPGQGHAATWPGMHRGAPELDEAADELTELEPAPPAPVLLLHALPIVNAPSPTVIAILRSIEPEATLRRAAVNPALAPITSPWTEAARRLTWLA